MMRLNAARTFVRYGKVIAILLTGILLQLSARAFTQKITITVQNAPLEKVLKEVHKQSGYLFLFNAELIQKARPVSLKVTQASLEEVLNKCFANQPFTYELSDKTILVKYRENQLQAAAAPPVKISGKVTDDNGAPLSGVTVTVTGSKVSAVTDGAGAYAINVPSGKGELQFAFIGYTSQTKPVSAETGSLNVVMAQQPRDLDEVVVAYGARKRSSITNAVSQIKSADIDKRPITNLNSALTGAAPGIQTTTGGGQPGNGPSIRIRGFGSINAGSDPLYVVDGAVYVSEYGNINPDDIESISVLKDASASALYGSRAANGVIVITTKKGKKDKSQMTAKIEQGFTSRASSDYRTVSPFEYYPLMWEAYRNSLVYTSGYTPDNANTTATNGIKTQLGYNPFNVADNEIVGTDGKMNPNAKLLYGDDLNWKKYIRRTGGRGNYNLNISGGSEKSDYFLSAGYLKDDGFSIKSNFERATLRLNVNAHPTTWFKAGVNISGTLTESDQANTGGGLNENPFYIDYRMGPIYPVHEHDATTGAYILDENGNRIWDRGAARPVFSGRHIVEETMLNEDHEKRNALNATTFGEVQLYKGLKFTTNFSASLSNYIALNYANNEVGDAVGNGIADRTYRTERTFNFNQLLNYSRKFGRHSLDVLAGHESYSWLYNYLYGEKSGIITTGSTELDNFSTYTDMSSYSLTHTVESYLSRIEYNYDGRYFASASLRSDASSKFAPESRWGTFWSASAAWEIDRESFFKARWVDYLKLRASVGQVGSDALDGYSLYQAFYTVGYNNGSEAGIAQSSLSNRDIKWETNTSSDIAVEFGLLKNRITGTVEYFNRQSSNLLFEVPLPATTGLSTINKNIGTMYNRGWEFQLAGDIIRKKQFTWNLLVNASTFSNKITKMPAETPSIVVDSKKREAGHSMYDFYLKEFMGVDPNNGAALYRATTYDATTSTIKDNGDTVTTDANNAAKFYAGSAIPDVYGSFTNTFSYKRFSLQFMFTYQLGGKVYDNQYATLMNSGTTYGQNLHKDQLKRWQKAGDITDVPRMDNSQSTNFNTSYVDRWLASGSYLNLKTVSLSYNLPAFSISQLHLSSARLYLTAENLFMKSARKGLDPSRAFTGVISYGYDPARIVTFGASLSF